MAEIPGGEPGAGGVKRLGWSLILVGLGLWGSLFWQALGGRVSTVLPQPDDEETDKARLAKLAGLRDAVRSGDNRAMVRELDRFLPKADEEKIWPKLIRQLADEDASRRDTAMAALIEAGPVVLGHARRARSMETDLTARALLAALAEELPVKTTASALIQTIRQADIGKDPASVRAVYWRLVPHTPDLAVEHALFRELELDLATPGGVEAARAHVADPDPARRECAVRLLAGQSSQGDGLTALAKLVNDPDPAVSLRARLALLDAGQPTRPVALAERLADAPAPLCRVAESRLLALAQDADPLPPWQEDAASRSACADAWKRWLAEPGRDTLELKPTRRLERLLIGQINSAQNESVLLELDPAGKTLERLLTNDQIVACGYDAAGRAFVAKADQASAELAWPFRKGDDRRKAVDLDGRVVAVMPLEGGGYLVARRDRVNRLDADGKESGPPLVSLGKRIISGAARARDGWFALWRDDGIVSWHNATGESVGQFRLPPPQVVGIGLQALPGRRLLVPLVGENRLAELDRDGRELHSVAVESPLAALRLPEGGTVVGSPEGLLRFDPADHQVARQRVDWLPVALGVSLGSAR